MRINEIWNPGLGHAKGQNTIHENLNNIQSSVRNRLLVHQEINLPRPNKCSCKMFILEITKLFYRYEFLVRPVCFTAVI